MAGGGGSYFPHRLSEQGDLVQKSKDEAARKQLDSEINRTLRQLLAGFERDALLVRPHLEEIGEVLKEEASMEEFLFGGSVAKHTYVDGLSDVDALVILNDEALGDKSPKTVLNQFTRALKDNLTADKVQSVEKGRLAVTVKYRDGTELQLLPAVRTKAGVEISTTSGTDWKEVNPKAFFNELSSANARLSGHLVPTIKLVKSIVSTLPEQRRLSGYHVETLAVDAAKALKRSSSVRDLLTHVLTHASVRVLQPIKDVTGQSRVVDAYLGQAQSVQRRAAADAMASAVRKLNAAKSPEDWKAVIEGP